MSVWRRQVGLLWRRLFPRFGETFDLGKYAQQWCLPVPVPEQNAPAGMIGATGIDLNVPAQLSRLRSWTDKGYTELFGRLRRDERINCAGTPDGGIANGFYPTPDAECYAAMILDFAPDQILEIGSGYSTRIARRTIEFGRLNTRLRIIDPEPRAEVASDADEMTLKRVEDVPVSDLGITERTILFVDSSHICRARGDVPFLFCQVIPSVPKGTVIQVHDVYMPYDYPSTYDRWLWNEQYLLSGLLAFSMKFEVLLSTHLLCRQHTSDVRQAIGSHIQPEANNQCGASFWFRAVQ